MLRTRTLIVAALAALTAPLLATAHASARAERQGDRARPGQVRFRFVIDDNGTPSNPDDDFEVSSELIKLSTGRSDDYCDAIVPFML